MAWSSLSQSYPQRLRVGPHCESMPVQFDVGESCVDLLRVMIVVGSPSGTTTISPDEGEYITPSRDFRAMICPKRSSKN